MLAAPRASIRARESVTGESNDDRESRPCPVRLDRRQGLDDRTACQVHRRRRETGRAGALYAGALLWTVLLPGPGRQALQLHGEDPRRADDEAHAGARQEAFDGADRPDV